MIPSRTHFPAAVAFSIAIVSAGCDKSAVAIPRIDYSRSSEYGVSEFKDDAPANTAISDAAMPLTFVDLAGETVDLTQYRSKKKVVLIVLRGMPHFPAGVFCPSCLAQTSSLLGNQPEFARRGAEVLVVFPGPNVRLGEFLQKARSQTPGEPQRNFHVLLDEECTACERLGIRDDLAKPSTYILDKQGRLVYAYVGTTSTDRPSLKAIFAQLDKLP
jgi:peroxiredoxin